MITRARFVCAQCRTLIVNSTTQSSTLARFRPPVARVRFYATLPIKHEPTKTRPAKPTTYKEKIITPVFPKQLRIYAPSIVRIGGVVVLKATLIFVFLGTCLFVVPYAYRVQKMTGERSWLQLGALYILGATPIVVYSVVSAPFVTNISLSIPKYARVSKEQIYRYVAQLPPNTHIAIQTMRLLPLQKTRDVYLRDLRFRPDSRWRLANLERVDGLARSKEKLSLTSWESLKQTWQRRTPLFRRLYHIDPKFDEFRAAVEDRIQLPGIWEAVKVHIQSNSPKVRK